MISHRRRNDQQGFTLIELLVVIVILGVISGVVVFAVRGTGDKGKAAAVATDKQTLRTALETYCAQKGTYPAPDGTSGREDAMAVLVTDRFLSNASTYNRVYTGSSLTEGKCQGAASSFMIDPNLSCGSGDWNPRTWCKSGDPKRGTEGPQNPNKTRLVQLQDGRVFNGWEIFDPASATWAWSTPPPDVLTGSATLCCTPGGALFTSPNQSLTAVPQDQNQSYPARAMVVLKDDPATAKNECAPRCGNVLAYFGYSNLVRPDAPWALFDPAPNNGLGSWTLVASNRYRGFGAQGVQIMGTPAECNLNCGKVLVTGGSNNNNSATIPPKGPEAELYDPETNTFSLIGNYTDQPVQVETIMAPLPGAKVLVVERAGVSRVYDPAVSVIGSFSASTPTPGSNPGSSAFDYEWEDISPAVLPLGGPNGGGVLFFYDEFDSNAYFGTVPRTAIFRSNGTWSTTAVEPCPELFAAACHLLAVLPGGKVLVDYTVSGDITPTGDPNDPYSFGDTPIQRTWVLDTQADPGVWSRTGDLNTPDAWSEGIPAAAVLISGNSCSTTCNKVLAVNGLQGQFSTGLHISELYRL